MEFNPYQLRVIRRQKNVSVQELGESLGISVAQVHRPRIPFTQFKASGPTLVEHKPPRASKWAMEMEIDIGIFARALAHKKRKQQNIALHYVTLHHVT